MTINVPNDELGQEAVGSVDFRVIRLTPIWSQLSDRLTPPLTKDVKNLIAKEKVLQNNFISPQYQSVLKDVQSRFFSNHPNGIGVRSIMVSVKESIKVEGVSPSTFVVPDIATVLKNGSEQETDTIIMFPQTQPEEHVDRGTMPAVFEYIVGGVNIILNSEPEVKSALTPAILIYDLEKLEKDKGNDYTYKIKDLTNTDEVILGLYLLDIEPAK